MRGNQKNPRRHFLVERENLELEWQGGGGVFKFLTIDIVLLTKNVVYTKVKNGNINKIATMN